MPNNYDLSDLGGTRIGETNNNYDLSDLGGQVATVTSEYNRIDNSDALLKKTDSSPVTGPTEPSIRIESKTISTEQLEQLEQEERYERQAMMSFISQAENAAGGMAVSDATGNLHIIPESDNPKYGPTIRAANIMALANAFDLAEKEAAGIYDAMAVNIFGDKVPEHKAMRFVKQWQTDRFLQMNGINPKLWNLAKEFVRDADNGVNYKDKLNLIPEDMQDEFVQYVAANAVPKEYGFWGKAWANLKAGGMAAIRAYKNIFKYFPQPMGLPQGNGLPITGTPSSEEINFMTTARPRSDKGFTAIMNKQRKTAVFESQVQQALHSKENLKGGNLASRGFFGALRMAPATIGSFVSGSPLAFWYVQSSTSMFENMVSNGIEPQKAGNIAMISALPYAYTEMIESSKFLPATMKQGAKKIAKQTIGKYLKKLGKDYLTNMGQETIQGAIEITNTAIGDYLDKANHDIDYKKEFAQQGEQLIEAALALPWMMAPGKGIDLMTNVDFSPRSTQSKSTIEQTPSQTWGSGTNLATENTETTETTKTPLSDAERLEAIAETKIALDAIGNASTPFSDMLKAKLDILTRGGSREAIQKLEDVYNIAFGVEGIGDSDSATEFTDIQSQRPQSSQSFEDSQIEAMTTGKMNPEVIGQERPFKFDAISKDKEGIFTLKPTPAVNNYFEHGTLERTSKVDDIVLPDGIDAIVGSHNGHTKVQSLIFDRTKWSEDAAAEWWGDNWLHFPFFMSSGVKPRVVSIQKTEAEGTKKPAIEAENFEDMSYPDRKSVV
jgi:hypothetical protein